MIYAHVFMPSVVKISEGEMAKTVCAIGQ